MNTEIYSLATCPGTKYSGDTIILRATPRDGIGPYYVAFKKDGIIIDPSRLGAQPNPITNAPENVEITRTYTLNDEDVRNALTGTIGFSVFIKGSCPTGGGLQFDGVNKYVDAGNAASLNITNAITVEAWVKPNNLSTLNEIVTKSNNSGTIRPINLWVGGGYNAVFAVYDGTWHIVNSTNTLNVGLWYDIVGIMNGSNIMIYVNGVLTTGGALTSLPTNNNSLQIGTNFNAEYFNGTIDEVRIYNRALSPTEILGLYNGSIPRNGLVLEHIYSLGNANDLSGNNNNGTPINGPIFIPNACIDTCTIPIGCVAPVCNFVVT